MHALTPRNAAAVLNLGSRFQGVESAFRVVRQWDFQRKGLFLMFCLALQREFAGKDKFQLMFKTASQLSLDFRKALRIVRRIQLCNRLCEGTAVLSRLYFTALQRNPLRKNLFLFAVSVKITGEFHSGLILPAAVNRKATLSRQLCAELNPE